MKLLRFVGDDCVVYGLARGGVVVAREVALRLDVPLGVVVVRKLGHPGHPEFAYGAITASGDLAVKASTDADDSAEWLRAESKRAVLEAERREAVYMQGRQPIPVEGKVALLVDDGIATGLTMEVAIIAVRRLNPSAIVVAAPVASPFAIGRLAGLADEVVAVQTPAALMAIGQAYVDFAQVTDAEVTACLDAGPHR